MNKDISLRREKMLILQKELESVAEDRLSGRAGTSPDELDRYLESIIDEIEHGSGSFCQG